MLIIKAKKHIYSTPQMVGLLYVMCFFNLNGMNNIENQIRNYYPELVIFLNEHFGKDYFKNGGLLEDDEYLKICSEYAKWFNENKTMIIKNVSSIYETTRNKTSYNVLAERWKLKDYGFIGERDYIPKTNEEIEKHLIDIISSSMNHLRQKMKLNRDEIRIGNIGLLINSYIYISFKESEKRNKKIINYLFGLDVVLSSLNSNFIEVNE